jgi:hypothetical protein
MKALYILMFGLFSFAVHAQTSDNSIPPYYVDDVDCSGAMGQQGLMPSQIIGIEQFCAAMLSDEDGVANGKPSKHAEDIPVGAAASNGEPAMDDAIEQSATSTQIAVTKPTIETSSEATPDAADGAVITGPKGAEVIPVGAAASNGEPAMDDAIEQSATSTQIAVTKPTIETSSEAKPDADGAVITGPKGAEVIPVGAAASNGEPAMDDAIEQSATSTQMAVTKPRIETSSEARPDAVDGAAIIGRRNAEDIPVGPVQPSEQNSSIKDSTAGDELAVDDPNEQSATSTRIVATKPAIEHGQARIIEVDDVAITGPGYSQDVQVGATQVRKGQPMGAYSDQSDDPSRLDETIE